MDQAEFLQRYPTTPNGVLAREIGCTEVAVRIRASRLGIKKLPAYKAEVQRANATGKTKSPDTRKKIRAKALGRAISPEARQKALDTKRARGTILSGERHPNWKGGKPWERFRNPAYLAWRNAVLERDGYQCQNCRRQCAKYENGLAAHHLRPYAEHPDLRYEIDNGVTWCRACHMAYHGRAPAAREPIPCACGCGTMIDPVDRYGRPRSYVNYHGRRKER